MSLLICLENLYIQWLHTMSQVWNKWKRSNMIIIRQADEFKDHVIIMIVHKKKFSCWIRFCIWIFDVMLQKFHSYLIRRKIIFQEHYKRAWWKVFWRKSTDHDFLFLNDDHRERKIIVNCIDQFIDDNWFSIIRIDCIDLFYIQRHQYFFFFETINSKSSFVEIQNVTSTSNIQWLENIYITHKSLSHIWFMWGLISDHEQWFWLDFMKIESLSSTSESFSRRSETIVWLLQAYNERINQIMNELQIMIQ
jgi:hypothetical protein